MEIATGWKYFNYPLEYGDNFISQHYFEKALFNWLGLSQSRVFVSLRASALCERSNLLPNMEIATGWKYFNDPPEYGDYFLSPHYFEKPLFNWFKGESIIRNLYILLHTSCIVLLPKL